VHADLGYGGIEQIVARAIRESGRDIIPVGNGWGTVERVEEAFRRVCRAYGKERLEVFGLSCVDDDDLILGHDVWGPRGIVAKLLEMKRDGRVGATWCSTHGNPEYVERLVECGAFDAIMLAYNPLGFHALTYDAEQEGKPYEQLAENRNRVFPLAAARGVGMLVMKPLGGGLLVRSKAFPQRHRFSSEQPLVAADVLRSILAMPGVTAVVPGTATVAEAEENALAGHAAEPLVEAVSNSIEVTTAKMRTELCSRCGDCEPTCSKSLPISWLFREAYVWNYSADLFDAIDRHHYFHLHPDTTLACATCTNRTCECPAGIHIPSALATVHATMVDLRERGLMHSPPAEAALHTRRGHVAARVLLVDVPETIACGAIGSCRVWLENAGDRPWVPTAEHDGRAQPIYLRALADGVPLAECALRLRILPGERSFFAFELGAPLHPGAVDFALELVTPWSEHGPEQATHVATKRLECVDTAAQKTRASDDGVETTTRTFRQLHSLHPWTYTPTHGVAADREGQSLPVIVDRAEGCRIHDLSGREYIDYTMGWGTTVLGYGHPAVQHAIANAMQSAPLLVYPRTVQADVCSLLAEDFPGTTAIAFGKNGSDVCTLAARLARSYTGRSTILYTGYHGWGDFWVEQHGFDRTGVPPRDRPLIHRFRFNDTQGFLELFERYRHDLACVMLEPSGPWRGNEYGHEPDADQGFLATLRETTRSAGALLVFDEIITGYRYRQGSVQRARGIEADLTCLGKALASGMPLSALLGRGDVMAKSFHKTHYGPTFQAEAWSLAAAKATIGVFRRFPVAEHVWQQGEALRNGISAALAAAGLRGEMRGPPFRQGLMLLEPDAAVRHRQRTLLQQELLQHGVSIYNNGVMLTSFAHDDAAIARTLEVFRAAFDAVVSATRDGSLERRIAIPLLGEM
jgi:glutamate-1-semialdehyde aminotransferase/predicted aldo/keto reductase-like oxidoreductase